MYRTMIRMIAVCLSLFCVAADPVQTQAADYYKVTVEEQAPPDKLAEPIRTALAPSVVRLLEDDKVFYEFWFRKQIPVAERPAAGSFSLLAVEEGTLLGAIKVHEERYDFKDEEIPPGVYSLRLGLQPEDGDHLGTSPTPTFALLIPADDDRVIAGFSDHDELSDAASVVNAAEHPSNLSLQRVKKADGDFPRLASYNGDDCEVVCLRLEGRLKDGGESFPLTFALVFEGIGEF
jgi:hypothetical protein